jgi:hypothetical protein
MSVRSETYPLPRHLVVQALQYAIQRSSLAFRPDERNPNILFANSGLSLRSWGERITICITEHQGQTEVQVESTARWQLISWGKNQENVDRLFDHLHNCLPAGQQRAERGTNIGYCNHCGRQIYDNWDFCRACGVGISKSRQHQQASSFKKLL